MPSCTSPINLRLVDNNGQVELTNPNSGPVVVTQIPAGNWPSNGVTINSGGTYQGNVDAGACLMYMCEENTSLLEACATMTVDAATIFGPIKPEVNNGTGPFNYVSTVFFPDSGRTITVAGTDLNAAPSTITDTAGIVSSVDGTLGCWTLDRFTADIPPQATLMITVQVTDTSDGSSDVNTLSYIPSY